MEAPPAWFDFSTECVYTAQKHKKHKAWRDGICTCSFVRGWVVLKLYPEGATSNSQALEEWRIPPGPPASIAQWVYTMTGLGNNNYVQRIRYSL